MTKCVFVSELLCVDKVCLYMLLRCIGVFYILN